AGETQRTPAPLRFLGARRVRVGRRTARSTVARWGNPRGVATVTGAGTHRMALARGGTLRCLCPARGGGAGGEVQRGGGCGAMRGAEFNGGQGAAGAPSGTGASGGPASQPRRRDHRRLRGTGAIHCLGRPLAHRTPRGAWAAVDIAAPFS